MISSIIKLASINIVGYILNLVSAVILFLMYNPYDYASYASLTVPLATFYALIINLRLDFSITEMTKRRVGQFLWFLTISNLTIVFGITVILLVYGVRFPKNDDYIYILITSIILGYLISIQSIANNLFAKDKKFNEIAKLKISFALIFCVLLVCPLPIPKIIKFESYHIMAVLVGILITKLHTYYPRKKCLLSFRSFKRVLKLTFTKYKSYPLNFLPAALLNESVNYIIQPFVLFKYGNDVAGSFSMCIRIFSIPMALIGAGISRSIISHQEEIRQEHGKPHIKTINKITFTISFLITLSSFCVYLVTNETYLGKWSTMHTMIVPISIVSGFQLIAASISTIVYIKSKAKLQLKLDLMRAILMVLLVILISVLNLEFQTFLVIFSISFSVVHIVSYIAYYKLFTN